MINSRDRLCRKPLLFVLRCPAIVLSEAVLVLVIVIALAFVPDLPLDYDYEHDPWKRHSGFPPDPVVRDAAVVRGHAPYRPPAACCRSATRSANRANRSV